MVISDVPSLQITHTGFMKLLCSFAYYSLLDVFCVLLIKKKLIFIPKFCKTKHTSVEFFLKYFLVKDVCTVEILTHG